MSVYGPPPYNICIFVRKGKTSFKKQARIFSYWCLNEVCILRLKAVRLFDITVGACYT